MELAEQSFHVQRVGVTFRCRVNHQLYAGLIHPHAAERHGRRHVGVRREQPRRLAGAAFKKDLRL